MKQLGSTIVFLLVFASLAIRAALPPPVLTLHIAQQVSQAPKLDGRLDDPCWQVLPKTSTFYKFLVMTPTPTPLKTVFQLGYDDKGVYLGVRMYEKDMSKIRATITQRKDSSLWTDDSAEIYFDFSATSISFRKFVVNALGTRDEMYQMDPANADCAWCRDGWQAFAVREADSWTIEAFFPWADLGQSARDGDLWRFAICRFSWSSGQLASSAVGAAYSAPERYGWLLFMKESSADLQALAGQLQKRIPEDWLLPMGDQAIEKIGDNVRVIRMSDLLGGLVRQAQTQLDDCRRLTAGQSELAKTCDDVAAQLARIPAATNDAVTFQEAVGQLGKLLRTLEDLRYTGMLRQLLAEQKNP